MKKRIGLLALAGLSFIMGCSTSSVPQSTSNTPAQKPKAPATAIAENGKKGFYTLLILHKGEDTAPLKKALEPMARSIDKCSCVVAKIDDVGLVPLFEELELNPDVAPTPLAIALAPNRVITGVFTKPPTKDAIQESILPEQPLAVLKALQIGKGVIVRIQGPKTEGNKETNKAIDEFLADPKYKDQYVALSIDLDKPENTLFLGQLGLDPAREPASVLIGMVPPLQIANRPFRGAASKEDIERAVQPGCATG